MMRTTSALPLASTNPCLPLDDITRAIFSEAGRAIGRFRDLCLDSHFQPIYSLAHSRIVGHEALLRASAADGSPIPPLQALGCARDDEERVFVDRLCRALHLANYQYLGPHDAGQTWLFLNVSTQVVIRTGQSEPFFAELLAHSGFPARRVVVEILEGTIADQSLLSEAVANYRSMGCLVALDDFGADSSNIERIWRATPDIVKLDRKLIAAAEHSPRARRVLPATVALIHEAGSLALIEGVENTEQAAIALDSDADLVQGYYFARPAAVPLRQDDGGIAALSARHAAARASARQQQELQVYASVFQRTAKRLWSEYGLTAACAELLAMPRVDRCYLIGADGVQIGASVLPLGQEPAASRFAPLEEAQGANWSRKPYHYRALAHPGQLQVSSPYLSVANSRLCVTLSLAVPLAQGLRVLCCDIKLDELA
ncbi:EAL domain-containing protein [Pseudogulbenkiania sp. MAI-1]|uniref:sensor domain-containing phosphodiesterase n=1 Tax=Pseudogulbenkiania sp. MAI-1 TaxID=990370 RepID=UPI0004B870AB|nr:EAL domain-containing protein [Pseudogulbenkiania sp. MAI-1]